MATRSRAKALPTARGKSRSSSDQIRQKVSSPSSSSAMARDLRVPGSRDSTQYGTLAQTTATPEARTPFLRPPIRAPQPSPNNREGRDYPHTQAARRLGLDRRRLISVHLDDYWLTDSRVTDRGKHGVRVQGKEHAFDLDDGAIMRGQIGVGRINPPRATETVVTLNQGTIQEWLDVAVVAVNSISPCIGTTMPEKSYS
jgi:hypothetical protein